ncbi:Transposon Tf2-11 polyprotein [Frankliniella fusca]|uniref:Transposon Tf2-11 polyprotein n=1 Tax=Frankliniella fusca TaxID=407009 RepID=A0AAE1LD39_9NEOP|nr:Transposon Tf2-11 polyprotein [Frankliniella fusca]
MNGDELPEIAKRTLPNKKRDDLFEEVTRRLKEAYLRSAKYYNLRRREKAFSVGQLVFYANKTQSDKAKFYSKKLAPNYLGPCTVESRRGTSGYVLRNAKGELVGPYHVQDLVSMEDHKSRLRTLSVLALLNY